MFHDTPPCVWGGMNGIDDFVAVRIGLCDSKTCRGTSANTAVFYFIFSHDEYDSLLWVHVWISMAHVRRY